MLDTELKPIAETSPAPLYTPLISEPRQRRRMVLALVLLLGALGLVLIRDRDFWFPAQDSADAEMGDEVAASNGDAQPSTASPGKAALPTGKPRRREPVSQPAEASPSGVPIVTSRAVLPPLQIEVVAGDARRPIRPGNASVKVNLQDGAPPQAVAAAKPTTTEMASAGPGPLTGATERVRMSSDTALALSRPVRPEYPLLARQMKVQGSVLLEALIGRDGGIQDLHVLSGPTILAGAAREAVKQWRFKPYLQNGQPVDTQAHITVNFQIMTN